MDNLLYVDRDNFHLLPSATYVDACAYVMPDIYRLVVITCRFFSVGSCRLLPPFSPAAGSARLQAATTAATTAVRCLPTCRTPATPRALYLTFLRILGLCCSVWTLRWQP